MTSQIVVPSQYAGLKDAKAINEKGKKSIRGISEATSKMREQLANDSFV